MDDNPKNPENRPETEDEESSGYFIIDYLLFIGKSLAQHDYSEEEREDILADLNEMNEEIDQIARKYRKSAPHGAGGARKSMIEIIGLARDAVRAMLEYLEVDETVFLKNACENLKQAGKMTCSLKTCIAQQRLELAEILSGINKGTIKEGEPLLDAENAHTSIYLIDDQ